MKPRRKRVAPVSRQAAHESRRVWRHVTCALRAADCDAATAAKRSVEQAQREAVKTREANGEKWATLVCYIIYTPARIIYSKSRAKIGPSGDASIRSRPFGST